MGAGENENGHCQVGDQSMLRVIFGGPKLAGMERVARASRCRDLLLSLKNAAVAMDGADREAFAELVELARSEHLAATEEQAAAVESESSTALLAQVLEELSRMRDANAKMAEIATRLHAREKELEQNAAEGNPLWSRLRCAVTRPHVKD